MQNIFAETSIDSVIALVEDDVVLKSELDRRIHTIVHQAKLKNQSLPDFKTLQTQVLEGLINESIRLQMAQRAGVRISEQELNQTIFSIAKDNNMSIQEFRAHIENVEKIPFELYRRDIRSEIMIGQVTQHEVRRQIHITEREVDDLVKQIEEQGEEQIKYHLGHILIAVSDTSDQDVINNAKTTAQELVNKLRNKNQDFAQLAVAHSSGTNALKGGDFGWRSIHELPTLFAKPTTQLKIGDVSDPIRSGSGYHIIKLLDKRGEVKHYVEEVKIRHILIKPSEIMTLEEAKKKVEDIRQEISDGGDFSELAKKHSDDPGSANLGGVLDWQDPKVYVEQFQQAIQSLEPNKLSEPVQTQFGFHVIELLGRRTSDLSQEAKRKQAFSILGQRKMQEAAQIWMNQIRETSFVKILLNTN